MDPAWDWIWRAWWRLHRDRPQHPVGMGAPMPGAITWAAVQAWAARHGYGEAQADMLDAVLQRMDEVWLQWAADKRRKEAATSGNPAHRPPRR